MTSDGDQQGQGLQVVMRERTGWGVLGRGLFWVFNIGMAWSVVSGMAAVGGTLETGSDAERAGAAIGTVIGLGMLLGLWAAGAVIFGVLALLTRGPQVIATTPERVAELRDRNRNYNLAELGIVLLAGALLIAAGNSGPADDRAAAPGTSGSASRAAASGPTASSAASAPVSPWQRYRSRSEIDDSPLVTLTSVGRSYESQYGLERVPHLTVRCMENTTSVILDMDRYLGSGTVRVTTRVDDAPARTHQMQVSTDNEAVGLWRGGQAIPFIRTMLGAETLTVRVEPRHVQHVTTSFAIRGLDTKIDELATACNWTP